MKSIYRGIEITKAENGTCTCVIDGREKTAPNFNKLCDRIRSHQWHASRKAQGSPALR